MKKLIAIIMVLCMALGLAGCGNSGDETTATPTEAPITVDGSMQPKTISAGCCFVAVREDGTVGSIIYADFIYPSFLNYSLTDIIGNRFNANTSAITTPIVSDNIDISTLSINIYDGGN